VISCLRSLGVRAVAATRHLIRANSALNTGATAKFPSF